MKIRTNFDLIEKTILAKRGFSMKEYTKDVIESIIIANTVCSPIFVLGGAPTRILAQLFCGSIPISITINGASNLLVMNIKKEYSKTTLVNFANQLGDIYFDTDAEMLMNANLYKREYKISRESFPPKIVEHKYIMVPVNNDWGNNERSLHQEHIIGTRYYDYSYGEPEKEKVYSYARKRAIK